jgi:hypothetical protein
LRISRSRYPYHLILKINDIIMPNLSPLRPAQSTPRS